MAKKTGKKRPRIDTSFNFGANAKPKGGKKGSKGAGGS